MLMILIRFSGPKPPSPLTKAINQQQPKTPQDPAESFHTSESWKPPQPPTLQMEDLCFTFVSTLASSSHALCKIPHLEPLVKVC